MKQGDIGICSGCGQESEAGSCCEEVDDFLFGRPAVQKHYYIGSRCCGEPMDDLPDDCA